MGIPVAEFHLKGGLEMLKYFVDTTEGLITASIIVGLIFGFTHSAYEKTRKIPMTIGAGIGN